MTRLRFAESPLPLLAVFGVAAGLVALFDVTALTRVDPVRVVAVGGGEDAVADRHGALAEITGDPAVEAALAKARAGDGKTARKELAALSAANPANLAAKLAEGSLLLRDGEIAAAEAVFADAVKLAPRNGTVHFDHAVALERAGKPVEADAEYVEAARLSPGLFAAWFNLAELRLEQENFTGAIEAFRSAAPLVAAGAGRSKVFTRLGVALRRAERYPEAREAFGQAINFRPANTDARLGLVRVLLEQRELTLAREEAQRVIALDPSLAASHWLLGQIAEREGNREDARRQYVEAVRLKPGSVEMRFALARVELSLGNLTGARSLFEALDREHAGDPDVLFQLGRVAYRDERWKDAIARYRAAIEARKIPTPENWLNLGLAFRAAGERSEARDAYEQALALRPTYAEAMFNLGVLALAGNDDAVADAWFGKAIAAEPAYAEAWFNRAILASRDKRPADAESAYRKALAARPGYVDARLNLAALLSRSGRFDQAIEENRAVLRTDPDNAKAWFNLGRAWSGAGKLDEAEKAYRTAVKLDPEYGAAWQNLGVVLADKGDPRGAITVYREALDRKAGDAKLRYNLALQHEKLDDLESAEAELRRAVRLAPGYQKAWTKLVKIVDKRSGAEAAKAVRASADAAIAKHPETPDNTDGP